MNVAFPALLLFLLILPGLFFTLAFYNTDNKPLNYVSLTHKAALSFIVTFFVHVLGLLCIYLSQYQIDLTTLIAIISGAQGRLYAKAIDSIVNETVIFFVIYLLLTYCFAFFIGKLSRWGIRKWRLDKKFKLLRLDSPWYYLFTGYDWEKGKPDGVMISAAIEFSGKGYLYQGYLEDFFLNDEGNIDRLVLTRAERRSIENDKVDSGTTDKDLKKRFYPIDGDYFVLKYSEIKSLNVLFLKVTPDNLKDD